jgi:hypothetical protein
VEIKVPVSDAGLLKDSLWEKMQEVATEYARIGRHCIYVFDSFGEWQHERAARFNTQTMTALHAFMHARQPLAVDPLAF